MPAVSVILPLHNGRDYIPRTLQSLLDQTFQDFEVLIIDDGSTDDGALLLERFLKDPRFLYIKKAHEGIPKTRNFALRKARGRYIAFLDQDDLYRPKKLEAQVKILEAKALSAVHTAVERMDGQDKSLGMRPPPPKMEGNLFETFLARGVAVPLLSVMLQRDIFEAVGYFDESLFGTDDLDFLLRVAAQTPFGYISEPLVLQRFRPGTAGQTERMSQDRFLMAKKMHSLWPEQAGLIRRFEERSHYLYGSQLFSQGRMSEARGHFAAALGLVPWDWRAALKWLLSWIP